MQFWNDRWGRFLTLTSLRPKLLLIVALALGPLALASIGQGLLRFQTRHEDIDSHLLQMAIYATSNERNIFSSIEGQLQQLADRPEIRDATADCSQTLAITLIGRPLYLGVSRIDASGKLVCGASSALLASDYSGFAWWRSVRTSGQFVIGTAYYSPSAKREVLPVTAPIRDAYGKFAGALSASVDINWLNQRAQYGSSAFMLIMNRSGHVVASNRPVSSDMARKVAFAGTKDPQDIFPVKSGGTTWQWAVQNIAQNDMIVAFGIREPGLLDMSRIYFLADILLPLLMIALASIAIWLGTEWLVIRWTTYLQRVSAAYGQNHFTLEMTELENAPEEFRQLGHEMKNMAASIRDRDRKLNNAIQQETAMAREIHHRVKNNLQIVSSLISLYSQRVGDPNSRMAFRHIGVRVNALTLLHRLIEKSDTTPVVDMKALFTEMADQMRATAAAGGRLYRVSVDVEQRSLAAATATPVALFAVEALSFGMFRDEPDTMLRVARLSFGQDGPSHLLLAVEDNTFTAADLCSGIPSPQRFLTAFADQLQGRYWVKDNAGGGCTLSLRIPGCAAITGAEKEDAEERPAVFHFRAPGGIKPSPVQAG